MTQSLTLRFILGKRTAEDQFVCLCVWEALKIHMIKTWANWYIYKSWFRAYRIWYLAYKYIKISSFSRRLISMQRGHGENSKLKLNRWWDRLHSYTAWKSLNRSWIHVHGLCQMSFFYIWSFCWGFETKIWMSVVIFYEIVTLNLFLFFLNHCTKSLDWIKWIK